LFSFTTGKDVPSEARCIDGLAVMRRFKAIPLEMTRNHFMELKNQTFLGASTASLWMILLILVVGSLFSALIPPFQSPDEFDHIKRAYLLSSGTIILDAPEGHSSGGMIDSGLAAYFASYGVLPFKPDRKLSADEINLAKSIKWTGIKEFSPAPGTGYYFPIIYTPQAIGLALGEKLGLSVDTSYHLARFNALAFIAVLLFAAFSIYNVNPLVISMLILPMSIFQFSTASLDGISTALAVLSISVFLKIFEEKTNTSYWTFLLLTFCVVLLATSRVYLLPLLILVLMACFFTKNRSYFYVFIFALLFTVGWLAIAIKTTVDTRIIVGASTSDIVLFYIKNPIKFFDVFGATLTNDNLLHFYRDSFFGVLGWLDTKFSAEKYKIFFLLTLFIGLLSVSFKNLSTEWVARVIIFVCAIFSIFLIFFALLITWSPHPASIIQGVQGRYFLIPMIMVAYAIAGGKKLDEGILRKISLLLVIILGAFTMYTTPRLLLERYFIQSEQPGQISAVLRASVPLQQHNPITLLMSKVHEQNLQPLKRIGIRFGTHIRNNPGIAELRLATSNEHELTIPFDLSELADNTYKYFELDSMPYSSCKINYLTGGGVSTWEVHDADASVETCLIFEYANGKTLYTRGCPRS
jgi:uncharacterized membrane protein